MNDNIREVIWDTSLRLNKALEMMEEIHAAGYALVPLKPTSAMVRAGVMVSGLDTEQIHRIYLAMTHAAGDELGSKE